MLNKIVTSTHIARKILKYCYYNDRNIKQFCNPPPHHDLIIFVTPLFFMKKFYNPPPSFFMASPIPKKMIAPQNLHKLCVCVMGKFA